MGQGLIFENIQPDALFAGTPREVWSLKLSCRVPGKDQQGEEAQQAHHIPALALRFGFRVIEFRVSGFLDPPSTLY